MAPALMMPTESWIDAATSAAATSPRSTAAASPRRARLATPNAIACNAAETLPQIVDVRDVQGMREGSPDGDREPDERAAQRDRRGDVAGAHEVEFMERREPEIDRDAGAVDARRRDEMDDQDRSALARLEARISSSRPQESDARRLTRCATPAICGACRMPISSICEFHSAYSLSEGAIKIKELIGLCKAEKMPAVAMTDTDVFGALEFCAAAAEYGVQPILGCQIWVRYEAEGMRQLKAPDPAQLVLLVQNREGYANLIRLISEAFLETPPGETPQVRLGRACELSGGLIALTGGVKGSIARALLEGRMPVAEASLTQLAEAFAGRAYVELQRHGLPEEERVEELLIELAYRFDLPLVATNEPYFAGAEVFDAHDALLAHRRRCLCRAGRPPQAHGGAPLQRPPPRCARCSRTCPRLATTPW